MFENPRRGRQAINFTTDVLKILDLKSSSEQIFFLNLSLGAPDTFSPHCSENTVTTKKISLVISSTFYSHDLNV